MAVVKAAEWRMRRVRSEKLMSELEELIERSRSAKAAQPSNSDQGMGDYLSELRRAAGLPE